MVRRPVRSGTCEVLAAPANATVSRARLSARLKGDSRSAMFSFPKCLINIKCSKCVCYVNKWGVGGGEGKEELSSSVQQQKVEKGGGNARFRPHL